MNKLNRMLIASPSEFAAIFGEVASDVVAQDRADTTGFPQGVAAVAATESALDNVRCGNRKSLGSGSQRSMPIAAPRAR